MFGIMSIAAYVGKKFWNIPLINKRATGTVTIGFALNATTSILDHDDNGGVVFNFQRNSIFC